MKSPHNHIDCFLDLDGVLADFFTEALKHCQGSHLLGDWPDTSNWIHDHLGFKKEDFWDKIPNNQKGFWRDLPVYPWASDFYGFLKNFFQSVTICTSPSRKPCSYSEKVEWVYARIDASAKIILIDNKELLARHDRFLIDDMPSNIQKWRSMGGLGMVFPRPWNTKSYAKDAPFASSVGYLMSGTEQTFCTHRSEPWEIFPVESLPEERPPAAEINLESFMRP